MADRKKIREHLLRFKSIIQTYADTLRPKSMPGLSEEKFLLYEQNGNRLLYENDYFERRKFLVVFALSSLWDKKTEDLYKLSEVIQEICEEKTWALPAHVNRSKEDWINTVDLFAAETAQSLSCIHALLQYELSESVKREIQKNVENRVLFPYRDMPEGSARFEQMDNNWAAVCLGCIGSSVLYLYQSTEPKSRENRLKNELLTRVCRFLPNYLQGIYEDGTCPEGLSYFTYGMVYYTGFARHLREYTKGVVDLLCHPKIHRLADFQSKCYLPGNITVSFSDSERRNRFRLGLSCFLALEFPELPLPPMDMAMHFEDDHCYRFMANLQDCLWVEEFLNTPFQSCAFSSEENSFLVLPDAQWAIWKKKSMGIACKGGHNDEPHNHNDVGSFLLTAEGEIFLADLGCGEYTKDYFGNQRYSCLTTRSSGHNVPLIANHEQKPGKEYHADAFLADSCGRVKISFAGAYEKQPHFTLTRELISDTKEEKLLLFDQLVSEENLECIENFVTQIEPKIQTIQDAAQHKRFITLCGKKGILTISNIPSDIWIEKEVFRNHHGVDEPVWLIRFILPISQGKSECKLCIRYERNKSCKL